MLGMGCEVWTDAVVARSMGRDPGVDERLLDAHLQHCDACRSAADPVGEHPGAVLTAAPDMPDLSRRIASLNAVADRAAAWSIIRILLAVVAVEVIVLSVPALVLGEDADASAHDARHLGAFTIAYGVMLLVVVVRPARARTALPVAAVLAAALFITAVVDLVQGNVPLVGEALHIPEIISVGLIWLLAVPVNGRGHRWPWSRDEPAGLHLVDDADDRKAG